MIRKIGMWVTFEGLEKAGLLEKTSWYVDSETMNPPKKVSGAPQLAVIWVKGMHGFPVTYNESHVELYVPHATMLDMGKSGWVEGNPTREQWLAFVKSCAEHSEHYLRNGIKALAALDCAAVSIGWEHQK